MYPVSAAFKESVRRPHTSAVKAEVWRGDQKVLDLQPLNGTVDVDGRRAVRRTCSVTLTSPRPVLQTSYGSPTYATLSGDYATYTSFASAVASYGAVAYLGDEQSVSIDSGIVPDDAFDALAPFGNELRLYRGIRVDQQTAPTYASIAGSTYTALAAAYATYGFIPFTSITEEVDELVPLGVFRIESVEITDGDSGVQVQVTGSDRSAIVSAAQWTDAYAIASGTTVDTAINGLLANRYDDVQTSFTTTTTTVPSIVLGTDQSSDPWRDAVSIATAAGLDLYFDANGIAVLSPSQSYEETQPEETYLEDSEAMLLGVTRSLTSSETFNGVIATGEGTEAGGTIRAEAWDNDPASPTYYLGIFGRRPYFYSSPLITTATQAQNAAAALLSMLQGATESVEWSQIVDPSLDSGDVIAIFNSGTKVNRVLVIDRLTIPLNAGGTLSATARNVRTLEA